MVPDPARRWRTRLCAWQLTPERRALEGTKNLTQRCRTRTGTAVLVKGAANPFDGGVAREAAALRFLGALDLPFLRLPQVHAFDPKGGLLALRWIDAPTLHAQRLSRGRVGRGLWTQVGRSLGTLHRATTGRGSSPELAWAAPPEETLLDCFIWTRPSFATRLSPGGMRLFGTVQADASARDGLVELAADPPGPCLIHGDAKELNLLAGPRGPVWLDWELAQWGDPAQDLGSLVADLLRCQVSPESAAERLPPPEVQAGRDALLAGYVAQAGPLTPSLRRRLGLWTGAHLLFYAHAQVLADGELQPRTGRLLQEARRLLSGGPRG
jgi:tRNA A-37 threonylcarbamoyl transferase component Bud32